LSDACVARHAFYHDSTFKVWDKETGEDCFDAGYLAVTRLGVSEQSPRLSNEPSSYTFGLEHFLILSVGSEGAIFQHWRHSGPDVGSTAAANVEIVDLASYPDTLACPSTQVGSYTVSSLVSTTCETTLCVRDDACVARWELLAGIVFNGGDDYTCPVVEKPEAANGQCSPPGRQWKKHPWACTDQEVEGGCFFCKGVAKGEQVQWCLNREGAGCNQIFESQTAVTLCNMEFECPASVSGASLFIIFVAIFALFLQ
jgi:hypothetical protein